MDFDAFADSDYVRDWGPRLWDLVEAMVAMPDAQTPWQDARQRCRDRLGWKCGMCGQENGSRHVHHILPRRWSGGWKHSRMHSQMNLCVLCKSCHRRLEGAEHSRGNHLAMMLWLLRRKG